ncbi:MAG: phosphate/phosphite/phosphonate ABC transporter substrate-binding protein [Kiloniellales bacterium]|nr:phosphate/phosphite/phosphonate ABC transporter substrate-binding protein [Kiloniellales bacterium]
MPYLKSLTMTALASFAALGLLVQAAPASAQADCPRGDLDERYCDRNGDLVADAPTDPSQWVDPDTLVFGYVLLGDPAPYKEAWSDFLEHMEKVTGKKVLFFPPQSDVALIEAMRSGRLHVAGVNTGSNPLAVNCAGFVSFAMMARLNGDYGYSMEILTYPGSGIEKVEDIKGRTLAFTGPTSNSGFKAPLALLKSEFDMIPGRDFETVFSGAHDNSILGVANRDYDAAAIANPIKLHMIKRDVIKEEDTIVLYQSQKFPTGGYGHVFNLKPELAEKVKESFMSFQWDKPDGSPTSLKVEYSRSNEGQFIPITYQEHWNVIRKIDAANNVSYNCN